MGAYQKGWTCVVYVIWMGEVDILYGVFFIHVDFRPPPENRNNLYYGTLNNTQIYQTQFPCLVHLLIEWAIIGE